MQRYFISTPTTEDTIQLTPDTRHHLIDVMRAQVGTQFELVVNHQNVYLAELVDANRGTAKLLETIPNEVELPLKVTLACGLPKTKEKPEMIVQKATELGAHQIVFFEAQRSVSHWTNGKEVKKLARLQKIANAAAEQAHRIVQPRVTYVKKLEDVFGQQDFDIRLVAWEESAKQGETKALVKNLQKAQAGQELLAIFGPEGGLAQQEIDQLATYQVEPVGLGPRILRTETAPLYLMSAISYQLELFK